MLRIIHTADVHLGARHDDLGEQASAQRERQFAAFTATVDLALAEKADILLIAGDLFDSNVQPKRSVERVAAQLHRLVGSKIRTVIVPGTHDSYDRASIYRAYDLKTLAGSHPADDLVTILTPERPSVHLKACDAVIHGPVFPTKRAPYSPVSHAWVSSNRTTGISVMNSVSIAPTRCTRPKEDRPCSSRAPASSSRSYTEGLRSRRSTETPAAVASGFPDSVPAW